MSATPKRRTRDKLRAVAEAGITPGLRHHHFPTEDALLEEAMRSALQDYVGRHASVWDLTIFWRRRANVRARQD